MTIPVRHAPVRLDTVHKCASGVLQCKSYEWGQPRWADVCCKKPTVSVIMVHFSQHIYDIRVEHQVRAISDTERIELMSQRAFSKHKLSCVCPIKTIDAVCSADPVLQRYDGANARITVMSKTLIPNSKWRKGFTPSLALMRIGFGPGMEETRLLDPLLRQVFEIVDYILGFSSNNNIRWSPITSDTNPTLCRRATYPKHDISSAFLEVKID